MRILRLAAASFLTSSALLGAGPAFSAGKPTRFWNLTSSTVTELRLAPAGTETFGENQGLKDKDNGVEHDERLEVGGVETAVCDANIGFEDGRVYRAKHLSIEAGQVFSIEDKDLVDCSE